MSDHTERASERLAHLPALGYAAKRLEDELSAFVDALLGAEFGLRRRHWQLLRWADESPEPTVAAFVAEAATFYTGAEARQIVDDVVERGWIHRNGDALELTDDGRDGFAAMRASNERTWDVVLDGLTEQDYVATVTAMTTMADNLGRAGGTVRRPDAR